MGRAPLRADGTVRPRLESGEDGLHGDVLPADVRRCSVTRAGRDRTRAGPCRGFDVERYGSI
jgi:hypothetical protein